MLLLWNIRKNGNFYIPSFFNMKKFLLAFLGSLAGIWFSLFIAFFGLILVVAAAGVASLETVRS